MSNVAARILLSVGDISKRFGGVQALASVDFDVRAGEVHCLAGANGSGKSTLIKVISGVVEADEGNITLGTQTQNRLTPLEAVRAGIQVIPQDLALLPNLSVAENIAINPFMAQGRWIYGAAEAREIARAAMERVGVSLPLSAPVRALSVADRQVTAICRALAQDASVVFMNEPTTALTRNEIRSLVAVIGRLNADGVGVVFVSHKLEEVLELSQRVTVLRDGAVVAAGEASEFDREHLTEAMMGHAVAAEERRPVTPSGEEPVLKLDGLSRADAFEHFSLSVRPGEIIGIAGVMGSGRTAVAQSLFGLESATSGRIEIAGKPVQIRSVHDALVNGIAYVPEDRLSEGLFLDQSIANNFASAGLDLLGGRCGWLTPRTIRNAASQLIERLAVKIGALSHPVSSLSGGNQQRIVLGKWLLRAPRILILNGPTVGVDVDSKSQILDLLRGLATRENTAIIIISDDLGELESICGRVVVMRRGRIATELVDDEVGEERLYEELIA